MMVVLLFWLIELMLFIIVLLVGEVSVVIDIVLVFVLGMVMLLIMFVCVGVDSMLLVVSVIDRYSGSVLCCGVGLCEWGV